MWQKSLRVAYTFDRVFVYFSVTSPPSVAASHTIRCGTARFYSNSRIRKKKWRFLAPGATYHCFLLVADVITLESITPDRCAVSSTRRNTGVFTGSSTFEPLAKKASYTFTAAPK